MATIGSTRWRTPVLNRRSGTPGPSIVIAEEEMITPSDPISVPLGPANPVTVFVARVRAALALPGVAERLAQADVRAQIDVAGLPGATVTLLLDRSPATVVDGPHTELPTVRLTLTVEHLGAMLDDSTHLPVAILGGAVTFEGPVRKLLRIMPILRGAVERAERPPSA